MNTMTFNKAAGAFLGALLFFLLVSSAADALYSIGAGEAHAEAAEGEGEGEAHAVDTSAPGDLLEASAGEAADTGAPAEVFDVAAGDPAKGEKVFGKCKACHKIDGSNATGPHLDGVVDRAVAGVEGFAYSDAMKAHGGTWTAEALNDWITDPKAYIPGNKMSFAGLKKVTDRQDLIAYLAGLK